MKNEMMTPWSAFSLSLLGFSIPVCPGDCRVKLTKLEFEVFLYLHEHENKPITRASLIEKVWGAKYAGSHAVEAVARSLRKRLGSRAAAIETIRNVGYRFHQDCKWP